MTNSLAPPGFSFPRYEKPTGALVKSYLNGAFGPAMEVDAKQASILYALDRWASFKEGDFAPLAQFLRQAIEREAGSAAHGPSRPPSSG